MFKVNKSLIKKVYSIIMVSIFLVSSSLSVSANSVEDTNFNINLELLDTVAEPKANYNRESSLSQIAVNYFVTGGLNNTYVYFEHYTPFTYVRLY